MDIIKKPALLMLVYFTCDYICPRTRSGRATVLAGLKLLPGKDYQLITISFDAKDNLSIARQMNANHITAIGIKFPPKIWALLTGDMEGIACITDSVGFRYYGVDHPVTLSSAVLNAGLDDACRGVVALVVRRPVLYCFTYQPVGTERFFSLLVVTGIVTLTSAAALFIYIRTTSRRSGS